MKGKLKKLLIVMLCMSLICNIVGMQGFGKQMAYAAADIKITGVTASASSETVTFEAKYAIDNASIESYWSAYNPGVCWLQLTLDHIYYIDRWYVIHMGQLGWDDYTTRDFKLQGSLDGTTWTNIDSVVGNTAAKTNRTVAPFSAKYVRIYITDPDQFGSMDQAYGNIVDFEVFAIAPVVTSVELPSDKNYSAGNALTFKVKYPAEVTVNTSGGTPYIPVTIGSKTVNATYKSGSGTQSLTFEYIVQSGDYDDNGIKLGTSINSNGGTIRDYVSNNTNLTLNGVGGTSGIVVDARTRYKISIGTLVDGSISASVPSPYTTSEVVAGETINLSINPEVGKQLKVGSLKYNDGTSDHTITGTSFVMPEANVTVSAEFEAIPPTTYTVKVGTLAGGSITANPTVAEAGEMITLTLVPDAGKQLKVGSLKYNDGTSDHNITGTSFVMPEANVTVLAEFEVIPPTTYTVKVGTLAGGSITANPSVAEAGEMITLTLIPDVGKQLKAGSLKYNDGTSDHTITGTSFVMPGANVTVLAEFEVKPPTTYTVKVGTLAGGSITASPTVAEAGKMITLTITPDVGKQLKAGSLKYNDGKTDHIIAGTSFAMPEANVTVLAEFEVIPPTTYTVKVGTLAGGSITTNPSVAEAGEMITLTLTPDAGKQLKEGSLKYNDGKTDHVITGTSFAMPEANVTVSAEFEAIPPTTYTVKVGTLAGGSITANPSVAEAGEMITLTLVPDAGKQLKVGSLKYNAGTSDHNITGTSFVMPEANVTVLAEFEAIPPTTYTVKVGTLAGGSITASPTVAEAGEMITLTITPDVGKQLKAGSLKYNDGKTDHVIAGTSFAMPEANVTVSAEFEAIPPTTYTVKVGTLAGGSITANPSVAEAGEMITLTLVPDAGKQLKVGSLKYNAGTSDHNITGTSFVMPEANVTVLAEFEAIPPTTYTVKVGTLAGGSITASPTVAEAGEMITLTITPDVGKQLKAGSLKYNDGKTDHVIAGTSFAMPEANVTVLAEFEVIPPTTYTVKVGTLAGGSITASPMVAEAGEMITLTITPGVGKQLKAGSLKYNDGKTDHKIAGTSFTMPEANVTVLAEFEAIPPTTYTVKVGTLAGGSITASPTVAEAGEMITLTITPDAGKQLKAGGLKYNDGASDHTITGTSFVMPEANVTISAEFEVIPPTTYTVKVGTIAGGSITVSPSVAEAGETITLTITPDAGKQLKAGSLKYNDGKTDHVITGTSLVMPEANVTVSGEFEAIPPTTYTVTVGTLAGGSITVSPSVAEAGEMITLTITPDVGKQLKAGSLKYNDGKTDHVITGMSFTMPSVNITISAVFEDIPPTTYTVTVGSLAGGSITVSPSVVEAGKMITLTITPNVGKQLKAGSLKYNDGKTDHVITGTSFIMPGANVTVSAEFENIPPTTYTVKVGTLVGGSIIASPSVAEAGATITLTLIPDAGKQLKAGSLKYNDGTSDHTITGSSFTMPSANITISAVFEDIPPMTYTVKVGTLAGGSITVSPSVAEAGKMITLTITPDAGKKLKAGSLKYNDGTSDHTITGTSFTMPSANITISAVFEDIPPMTYTVTVGALAGGSITVSPSVAEAGKMITLTITPDVGKQLKAGSLKYNDGKIDHVITGTSFTMPSANIIISAEFENIPPTTYTVTVGTLAGGNITTNPTVAEAGEMITLTITPGVGKQLKAGSLKYNDGKIDHVITGTSFTMPSANITISAVFEAIPPTTYTVTVGTLAGGSITVSPSVAVAGKMITLTITPDVGKQLKAGSLKYNDGNTDYVLTGTSFVMPGANVTVSAEFENVSPKAYIVDVNPSSGGSIYVNSPLGIAGSTINLTITPDTGKQLKAGSLKYNDGTQDIAITGTSFIMPAANVTVTAKFEDIPANTYTITVGTLIGGRITASPVSTVSGSSISLIIIPDTGKQLKAGSLKYNDGMKDVVITGTSFIMPSANVTISAEFENISDVSTNLILLSIETPTAITGLLNGVEKSVTALRLPTTVSILTSGGSKNASVIWDVASCSYSQYSANAQSFTVSGVLTLPTGVVNTNNISLSVKILISVNQATNSGSDGSNSGGSGSLGNNPKPITDTNLPGIVGSEVKGWDSIIQYIAANNTGSITVDMNGDTTVTQEVLEAVRGKDIALTLDLGNGIQWIIHGTDIPESTDYSQLHDIDLSILMNTYRIPEELLNTLSGSDRVQISLAYEGSFGFTAILSLPLDEKNSGRIANLFYYNPVTNRLELQAISVVDKNGNVVFPFTHASDYVIVMSNTAMLGDAIDRITVTTAKKTLYIGGTKGNSVTIKKTIPEVVQKAVSDGVCDMTVTYKSNNPKVATVSASGKIIAKKAGTTTITTTVKINGVEKNFQTTIIVKKAYIKFTKSIKTMKLGESYTFHATGYGVETDDITFTTSVKSVVTINILTGKAIAKSVGIDYIIVKAGKVEVKIKVIVRE